MRVQATPWLRVGPRGPFVAPGPRLFLTSAVLLLTELIFIRWIQDYLLFVGFFSNFVLISSFLGIGLGFLLGRRYSTPRLSPFPPLLLAIVALVHAAEPRIVQITGSEPVFFGTAPEQLRNAAVVAAVVILVTAAMATLALPLGPLLTSMPPLRAYAIDIAGALLGIALFFVFALLWSPPWLWFGTLGLLLGLLRLGAGITTWSIAGGALLVCVFTISVGAETRGHTWSPYNRIDIVPAYLETVHVLQESRRYDDTVNTVVAGGVLNEILWKSEPLRGSFFDEVFRQFPGRRFERELVIGAGGGTDAAFALRAGVGSVDAVEIDPVIARIAGARHPERPYADPRVRVHTEDGRAFLRRSTDRYDLIVFAQTGSRAQIAAQSAVRLESFLFTAEAFASVREHLTPDGIFAIYWVSGRPLAERLAMGLESAFGEPPVVREQLPSGTLYRYVMFSGPGTAVLRADAPARGLTELRPSPGTVGTSDDWPFVHVPTRAIPPQYLLALGLLLLAGTAATAGSLRAGGGARSFSPHFFALGVAFLLLETRSLVTFSLLFGTSWLVNALVFFAILSSVLAAIVVNARFKVRRDVVYAGLFATIFASWLLPPDALLLEPAWLRYGAATALTFAPIFFANLAFAHSFRDTRHADTAFASNLLGAVVGGALEWTALLTGYRAQLILVAALYACAYLLATRARFGLDRVSSKAAPTPVTARPGPA